MAGEVMRSRCQPASWGSECLSPPVLPSCSSSASRSKYFCTICSTLSKSESITSRMSWFSRQTLWRQSESLCSSSTQGRLMASCCPLRSKMQGTSWYLGSPLLAWPTLASMRSQSMVIVAPSCRIAPSTAFTSLPLPTCPTSSRTNGSCSVSSTRWLCTFSIENDFRVSSSLSPRKSQMPLRAVRPSLSDLRGPDRRFSSGRSFSSCMRESIFCARAPNFWACSSEEAPTKLRWSSTPKLLTVCSKWPYVNLEMLAREPADSAPSEWYCPSASLSCLAAEDEPQTLGPMRRYWICAGVSDFFYCIIIQPHWPTEAEGQVGRRGSAADIMGVLVDIIDQLMKLGSSGQSPSDKLLTPQVISDNQKSEMIRHFMSQVKTEDLLNVAFMKPIEVALRTSKTDKALSPDSLPAGLMLVLKENGINDNKYQLAHFQPVPPDLASYDQLRAQHLDNYVSLLKKPPAEEPEPAGTVDEARVSQRRAKEGGMEVGICVSMCGEDKKALKKTLVGVAQNVDELIRSGVCPDDVFVVVMIDGVQSVDRSIYEYFEEFERESETFLEEDDALTLKKKYENYQYHQEIEKEEPLNFTKFLFKPEEFANRIESKFQQVRAKYDEVVRIRKSIQNIKKEHDKDNDNLKMILNRMIDKQKDLLRKIKSDKKVLINEQSIMKELANSEEECNQYLATRDSLAYLAAYRLRTSSLCSDLKHHETKQTIERSSMLEGQFETERMYDEELMDRSQEEGEGQRESRLIRKTIKYVNLFFCVKYKKAGKLSSHNWFFNGFCQEFRPKYTVLLDVGVRPYPDAIFKMYRCMKVNANVGSVCGYMRLIEEKVEDEEMANSEDMDCLSSIFSSIFDIQRAQQIEKHFEHLVEKPFESIFKFIHVLPGSFSAYSMAALRPVGQNDELLREYFREMDEKLAKNKIVPSTFSGKQILTRVLLPKTMWKCCNRIDPDSEEQVLYNENVYLAEDRILCLGIHKNDKDIVFMPDVYAQVEPIKMINELMAEKKREVNGGAYSFEKVRAEFADTDSKRSSFFIKFQLLYITFIKFLSYFAPALLVFIFHFAFEIIQTEFLADLFSKESKTGIGNVLYATITNIVVFIYALMLLAIFFFSLHLDYKSKKFIYYTYLVSTVLGLLSMLSFIVFLAQTVQGFIGTGDYLRKSYFQAVEGVLPGYGLFFVNALRYFIGGALFVIISPVVIYACFFRKFGILWDLFVGSLSYIFYLPTYAAIIPIYSRCRLDDISSATQGNLGARNQRLKETWKILKLMDVSKYLVWNSLLAVVLIILHGYILIKFFALLFLLVIFTLIELVRLVPVLIYTISYKCSMMNNPLKPSDQEIEENSLNNVFRVFNTVKRLEEDLRVEIQYSFELAAEDIEYQQEIKNEVKMEKEAEKGQPGPKPKKRLESTQFHLSRQSIKIMQNFQGNKFANIRESSALKANFYPFQFGAKREPVGPTITQEPAPPTPLEMVLLKQQLGQEAVGNSEMKAGEQKLKQLQIFRGTLARPIVK